MDLIEISDEEVNTPIKSVEQCKVTGADVSDKITLVQREIIRSEDLEVNKFIDFCLEQRLFDDSFYDYNNAFSIIATKLPATMAKMSADGEIIKKIDFIRCFKKSEYKGDPRHIFELIDKENEGIISCDDFVEFFLPFIKNITL